MPTPSKRAMTEGAFHNNSTAHCGIPGHGQPLSELLDDGRGQCRKPRRRAGQAAAEAVAAQGGRQIEHVAANAAAIGHGGQEADIAGQRAEIAEVVGHAFQFQGHAAEELGPCRHAAAARASMARQ